MPHRPGLAARRFYRSFYQWTLLTTPRRPAGQYAFHTNPRACEESNGTSGLSIRKFEAHPLPTHRSPRIRGVEGQGGGRQRGVERRQSNGQDGLGSGKRSIRLDRLPETFPKFLKENPVLSIHEKPFSSFSPGEKVVRYRSPEGVMLELAIHSTGLESARERWGYDLKPIAARTGARVEVQNLTAPVQDNPQERIISVLISGTFVQVASALDSFTNVSAVGNHIVQSQEEVPSATLYPWQIVLRGREGTHVNVEMSVREDVWSNIRDLEDWGRVAVNKGVAMEAGMPEQRPLRREPGQTAQARSLVLKGPESAITSMREMMSGRAGRAAKEQERAVKTTPFAEQTATSRFSKEASQANAGPFGHSVSGKKVMDLGSGAANTLPSNDIALGNPEAVSETPPRSEERLSKCVVNICGKDAFKPDVVDAIWREPETLPADVRMFRYSVVDEKHGEWTIHILGPSRAVDITRGQLQTVVANVRRRMGLKSIQTVVRKSTSNYKYLLTWTGKDAAKIKEQVVNDESWKELQRQFDYRTRPLSPVEGSEQRQCEIAAKPHLIGQIEKKLLELIRQSAKFLGAHDFKTTLTLNTPDMELPAPATASASTTAHLAAGQSVGHSEASTAPSTSRASEMDDSLKASEAKSVPSEQTRDAKSSNSEFLRHEKPAESSAAPQSTETLIPESDDAGSEQSHPKKTPEQQKELTENVRASLRSLTHPVVLITSRIKQQTQLSSSTAFRGVTVSSFNTVTLDPKPIISFNLKVPSRSWDAISQSRKLRVHLLEASSRGAAVAQIFTKPYDEPEMGFDELRKLRIFVRYSSLSSPPIIRDVHAGAVLAHLHAILLPEKCIRIGDHVVVLAEVTGVEFKNKQSEDVDGLAYAKRGYRTRGEEVLPAEIPASFDYGPNDPLALGAEEIGAQTYTPSGASVDGETTSELHRSIDLGDDPIYNALRATKVAAEEAARTGRQMDIYAAMAMEDNDFDADSWSAGRSSARSRQITQKGSDVSKVSERRFVRAGDAAGDGDLVTEDGISSGESQGSEVRTIRPLQGDSLGKPTHSVDAAKEGSSEDRPSDSSTPLVPPSGKRSFSTLMPLPGSRRGFSSTATAYREHEEDDSHPSLDPDAKNTTVGDFFGIPDDKRLHTPRVRQLYNFKKDIHEAEKRLAKGDLSEEEVTALQDKIAYRERVIARKLAWNAAGDLRVMIDKGSARVDFKRAQWLESAVEGGLKVLLEDARRLRQKREEGKVDAEKYEELRRKLEGDHEVLQTELTRLREVADDDD